MQGGEVLPRRCQTQMHNRCWFMVCFSLRDKTWCGFLCHNKNKSSKKNLTAKIHKTKKNIFQIYFCDFSMPTSCRRNMSSDFWPSLNILPPLAISLLSFPRFFLVDSGSRDLPRTTGDRCTSYGIDNQFVVSTFQMFLLKLKFSEQWKWNWAVSKILGALSKMVISSKAKIKNHSRNFLYIKTREHRRMKIEIQFFIQIII